MNTADIPPIWGSSGNGETTYSCTTCRGAFYAERTFQWRDGQYYCVEHILVAIGSAA